MSQRETRERLEKLAENKLSLAHELTMAGADSPHTDGLADLVKDVKEVVVPQGKKVQATVSGSGQVSRGQFVQRLPEYVAQGEALRWGLEDVHVLDACKLSEGRVAVVFGQSGATKLKVLALDNGQLALGNTLTLVEDEALESARVAEITRNVLLVVYNYEGAGIGSVVDLDGRVANVRYTDIWSTEDPENICVCPMNGTNSAMVTEVRQSTKHAGEVWAHHVRLGPAIFENSAEEENLVQVEHDGDIYAGGWSLCRVSSSTAVLYFPIAIDRPVGFVVLDLEPISYYENSPYRTIRARVTGSGKYAASLPCIATAGMENGWLVAYGVGWLSADKQVVESTMAVECWSLTRYGAELQWYSCEDLRFNGTVGGVGIEVKGATMTASYLGNGKAYALVVDLKAGTVGQTVPLGEGEMVFRMLPVSETKALTVTQKDGNGYAQLFEIEKRVSKSKTLAYGTAMTGGKAGEQITVKVAAEETN